MEEGTDPNITDGEITGIKFSLATQNEVSKSSVNECPINHASQLANPFLGLPLEAGKCESCGTSEPGKCEGHFGHIELPIPIFHPSHVADLRQILSLLCLKCLKLKLSKVPTKTLGALELLMNPCCSEAADVTIKQHLTMNGATFMELKMPSRKRVQDGAWSFLERYGYRYGNGNRRTLLPSEVYAMFKKLPNETKRKLEKKGYFVQDGYILRCLPVPPNCLSVPDVSDGVSVMSTDVSSTMLKKVLRQIELIKGSRSGEPNFESHEVEANELYVAVMQYLQASREVVKYNGVGKEASQSSSKAWLEKMKTLFISKGSGFSSRSVITGEVYKKVNEIGLPAEIAHRITFEERVDVHNINFLQKLVDNNLCLMYKDRHSLYSLRDGSKGHTYLKPGQVVHRRIMDGDIVFINRPPTTHKHSLQALSAYIHEDHTVKINPLMCGPLGADFDGDCVHLFYPQSLAARAEVLELFSVEKQLLSSHTGNLNLQLSTDSLLSLKMIFKKFFFEKSAAQQLAMFAAAPLPCPALRASVPGPYWTALQILQTALPLNFNCYGDRHLIQKSELLKIDFNRDAVQSMVNEIVTSILFEKSPKEALNFFDSLQPILMESLFNYGFSVGLRDFIIDSGLVCFIQTKIQEISSLLFQLRSSYNELVQLQLENYLRQLKGPLVGFILKSSELGNIIDSKSESGMNKIVQQIGFLGLQLYDRGKFYSKDLVADVASLFHRRYPFHDEFPCGEYGLVKSCFVLGLDPYEEMIHSISTREVIIRSSRGLAEPGLLFKNLMAVLRDVMVCYDGTIRNICSNSIIQFEYGVKGAKSQSLFPAGEPVGVLAATAMSNPAYKAVLDSSPSSNNSWEMMKEILFCRVNFKNDTTDRRVILYLNDCECGRRYCRENASLVVKNLLKKVILRDAAIEFLIEYNSLHIESENTEPDTGLVGHIHLNKAQLNELNINLHDLLDKCEGEIAISKKMKRFGYYFKRIRLCVSESCCFHQGSKWSNMPCLKFFWQGLDDMHLDKVSHVMADVICPLLLDTVIKGDPRIASVNISWINPGTTTWIRTPCQTGKGELAVEVVLEKNAVKQSGDAWRIVLDCCLPVFHLIDTQRSVPYAIKQIQDLLGISCAFDQAVQRLSASVNMVSRGVLKEHLILLASSMTFTGNLIGFYSGGIKALFRALGVQVPFTEATLYTPRKCFERAAEKCHLDSLSSIVASCSWGKHVAVGTGAKFDLLWGGKETKLGTNGVDVYDFLQVVRGSNEVEMDTGCLGDDVDDFELEDAFMEEDNSEAVFEDNVELGNPIFDGCKSGAGWESTKTEPTPSNAWGSSKKLPESASSQSWGGAATGDGGLNESGLGKPDTSNEEGKLATSNAWGSSNQMTPPHSSQSWGGVANGDGGLNDFGWEKPATPHAWGCSNKLPAPASSESWGGAANDDNGSNDSGWTKPAKSSEDWKPATSNAWGSSNQLTPPLSSQSWGDSAADNNRDLGLNNSILGKPKSGDWSGGKSHQSGSYNWRTKKDVDGAEVNTHTSLGLPDPTMPKDTGKGRESVWDSSKKSNHLCGDIQGWRSSSQSTPPPSSKWWGSAAAADSRDGIDGVLNHSTWEIPNSSNWSGNKPHQSLSCKWGSKKGADGAEADTHSSWGLPDPSSPKDTGRRSDSAWDSSNPAVKETNDDTGSGWNTSEKLQEQKSSDGWESKVSTGYVEETRSLWGKANASDSKKNNDGSGGVWGHGTGSSQVWVSSKTSHESGNDSQSPWGQPGRWKKNSNNGGWGSSDSSEWRNKRNRPAKPPGSFPEGSKGPLYTATGQPIDLFSSDEQEILPEMETVMQSIRRIMHRQGYNDGDPLSPEDHTYVLDNVFSHHPEKDVKMGAGIDHFMISKHTSFQESRCFYVVAIDGGKEDFSYRKCLLNYLKGKYPDRAETFISKYFKWSRGGGAGEVGSPSTGGGGTQEQEMPQNEGDAEKSQGKGTGTS